MNINKVSYEQVKNLGNYESIRIGAEAQLNETDNPLDIWTVLKDNAEMWFITEKNKDTKSQTKLEPAPTPKPTPQPQQSQSQDVLSKFPEPERQHVTFKDNQIYMKELVSHERWVEINETAKSLGYKWIKNVSDPKLSHWSQQP